MSDLFDDFIKKIHEAIIKYDSNLKPKTFITGYRGPYNWYPSYRIKWGTLVIISIQLAELFKLQWEQFIPLQKDFTETTYGLRTINQGKNGYRKVEDKPYNLLQLKGKQWITMNPTKKDAIGVYLPLANKQDVRYLLGVMQLSDTKLEAASKVHLDKMYHNSILVKTNLIKPNLLGLEYKSTLRVVTIPQVKEMHQYDFNPIYYLPLRVSILDTIKTREY